MYYAGNKKSMVSGIYESRVVDTVNRQSHATRMRKKLINKKI